MAGSKQLIAGNWKMNGRLADGIALARTVAMSVPSVGTADVLICPPATLLGTVAAAVADSPVMVGGQDCHAEASGAHTGDVAAEMLVDLGASHVIVGHSERRADHGEGDSVVAAKATAALRAGLVPIVCIGETEAQRDDGLTLDVVVPQLQNSVPGGARADAIVLAYEPVWAIGTGRTPTVEEVAQVHAALRRAAQDRWGEAAGDLRILYGGSVKPGNAAELLAVADVDGALVGGASLKADDFLDIVGAAQG